MLPPLPNGRWGTKISRQLSQTVSQSDGELRNIWVLWQWEGRSEGVRGGRRRAGRRGISGNWNHRSCPAPVSSFAVTFVENLSGTSSTAVHAYSIKLSVRSFAFIHLTYSINITCFHPPCRTISRTGTGPNTAFLYVFTKGYFYCSFPRLLKWIKFRKKKHLNWMLHF